VATGKHIFHLGLVEHRPSEAEQTKPPGMASPSTASAGNLRIAAVTVGFGSTVSAP
jgi:hypothetical protein